jgi:hypothetical protein
VNRSPTPAVVSWTSPTPQTLGVEVRCIERGAWKILLFDTSTESKEALAGHADVHRDGKFICRMVVAKSCRDLEELLASLEGRAHAWIDDWERRDHTGNTGFVQL